MGAEPAYRRRRRIADAWPPVGALAVFALAGAGPAAAGLGQSLQSVRADRIHMAAAMNTTTATAGYTIQTLTLPNGGTVREFANGEGMVFAVTWRGPGRPDLQQLLGEHFATLQAQVARPGVHRAHRPFAVEQSDFVVHSGGHPGAFWGVAYLPAETPAGFTGQDLH